jgi:hypothetical protein
MWEPCLCLYRYSLNLIFVCLCRYSLIMETILLNLVDSSFEHVLYSYGFHLVSTHKYEIANYLFYSISYLLDNHLSSFD